MNFDVQTGSIRIEACGENAVIVRKGKKIKIPSVEVQTVLINDFQKNGEKARAAMDKYKEDYPTLKDGDTIVCGSKTIVHLSTDYNKGKEKPIDDWKQRSSKSVNMGPNSELIVSGFEKWDETGKDKKRNHGELIRNIGLKKGLFLVSYSNTDDVLITPIAEVKFLGNGGTTDTFDVYENILYSNAGGEKGVEYAHKRTKASYVAKSTLPQEIIVTGDGIYKKGTLKMDDIFSPMNSIGILNFFQNAQYKSIPEIDESKTAEAYKNIPNVMGQAVGAFDMYSKMRPEDIERMMKIAEEHGAKISPEARKQMQELPEAAKEMQKAGFTDQMKKAMAMSKGMMEGLGGEGLDRLVKMQSKGIAQAKETVAGLSNIYTAEGKKTDVSEIFESMRKYKPLTDATKVA